jgi:hypothetical protein
MSRGGMYMGNRIIIVANTEEEMEIGQTLKNLIGKEGIFQAVLWDTKHYKAQEPALPSSQKIIFIGLNECSARNINSIEWKFSALNMRYGWIGSVALIHVLDRTLSKEEKESFKDMCLEQKKEVETLVKSNVAGTVAIAVASAAFGLLGLGIFAAVKIITGTAKEKKELQKRAYHYMITDFLFYGIDEFMEDSENAGI